MNIAKNIGLGYFMHQRPHYSLYTVCLSAACMKLNSIKINGAIALYWARWYYEKCKYYGKKLKLKTHIGKLLISNHSVFGIRLGIDRRSYTTPECICNVCANVDCIAIDFIVLLYGCSLKPLLQMQ